MSSDESFLYKLLLETIKESIHNNEEAKKVILDIKSIINSTLSEIQEPL